MNIFVETFIKENEKMLGIFNFLQKYLFKVRGQCMIVLYILLVSPHLKHFAILESGNILVKNKFPPSHEELL